MTIVLSSGVEHRASVAAAGRAPHPPLSGLGTSWLEPRVDRLGRAYICARLSGAAGDPGAHQPGSNRRLFPLLEQYPNLYIETSYYVVHRGIELICRHFGAERLLFGTGLPQRAPGPAITALSYSQISDQERALIASGNLRRLLAEVRA